MPIPERRSSLQATMAVVHARLRNCTSRREVNALWVALEQQAPAFINDKALFDRAWREVEEFALAFDQLEELPMRVTK